LLGNTPLFGFSTTAGLTDRGQLPRSVVVALLAGGALQARADFWPGYAQDSSVVQKMVDELMPAQAQGLLLLALDGLCWDNAALVQTLAERPAAVVGALTAGDLYRGRTYQIGGSQTGSGGLAAMLISGWAAVGVGQAHGWQAVGEAVEVTHARGPWVRTLNNRPASEVYASLLGYEAREWLFPPLNQAVRLYPLGIDDPAGGGVAIHSPIKMETDGSLRMNRAAPEGSLARLMVASPDSCQQAAELATLHAVQALGQARPLLGLVIADLAFQHLLEADLGREIRAVSAVLGESVPLIGGYTLGQVYRPAAGQPPEVGNQRILVTLIGEPESD
jgi:hypothetical protein